MIETSLLLQYPFFTGMDIAHERALAMICYEIIFEQSEAILEAGDPATDLYLVAHGRLALYDVVESDDDPRNRREYFVSHIGAGELAGLSALIPPHIYSATVRAEKTSRVIQIRAAPLRDYCDMNFKFASALYAEAARAVMKRLTDTNEAWIRTKEQAAAW